MNIDLEAKSLWTPMSLINLKGKRRRRAFRGDQKELCVSGNEKKAFQGGGIGCLCQMQLRSPVR